MNDEKVEKVSVSDLRAHAQVLVAMGLMPSLEKLLSVVAETRKKYQERINTTRQKK
jgi:UV DNA damage repair endonuclease